MAQSGDHVSTGQQNTLLGRSCGGICSVCPPKSACRPIGARVRNCEDAAVEQAILAPFEPVLVLSCIAFFQTILTTKVVVFLFFVKRVLAACSQHVFVWSFWIAVTALSLVQCLFQHAPAETQTHWPYLSLPII